MRKLPAVIHVLQNTQNLIISCCCFAEDRRERNVQRFITQVHSHCSALWTFCLVAHSLPLPSWLAAGLFSVPVPSRPVLQTKVRQKQSANKPWWQQMVYRNHRPWERQRIQGYNWNNKKSENTIFWIQVLSQGYVCTVLKTKNSLFMLPLQRNRQVLSGIFFLGVFSLFCT